MDINKKTPEQIIKNNVDSIINGKDMYFELTYRDSIAWRKIDIEKACKIFDEYIYLKLKRHPVKIDFFYRNYFEYIIKKWEPVNEEEQLFMLQRLNNEEKRIKEVFFLEDDGYYDLSEDYNPSFHINRKTMYLTYIIEKLISLEQYEKAYEFLERNWSKLKYIWVWLDFISEQSDNWRLLTETSVKYRQMVKATSDYRTNKWGLQNYLIDIFELFKENKFYSEAFPEIINFIKDYSEININDIKRCRETIEKFYQLCDKEYINREIFPESEKLFNYAIPLLNTIKHNLPESIYEINGVFENRLIQIDNRIDELFKQEIDTIVNEQRIIFDNANNDWNESEKLVLNYLGELTYCKIKKYSEVVTILKSGEWFWKQNINIVFEINSKEIMDLTNLVVSHFKSVEVFLFEKILELGESKILTRYKGDVGINVNKENINAIKKATIGNYNMFIKNNWSCVMKSENQNDANRLFNQIMRWTNNVRNSKLHKNIVDSQEMVEELRDKTKDLLILLTQELK